MLFLLLTVVIILLIILLTKTVSRTSYENLERSIDKLNDRVIKLSELINSFQKEKEPLPGTPVIKKQETVIQEKPVEIIKVTPAEEVEVFKKERVPEKLIKPEGPEPIKINDRKETIVKKPEPVHEFHDGWFDKWLRNNPDIEKFIGENLINKIGIAVLILGIAFFVKYAIDKEWINEIGRICIGLFCGIVLIFLSYRLRKNYRSFSSVLAGGGLTVFYFTIAFAFHQYELLSQSAAFIIMVVISAFAVALSILYNRIELGILATVGGFITPFLVSKGEGNYIVLFTYISILNAGLIVLAFYKRWQVIHFIAFVFTAIIYGAWILTNIDKNDFPFAGTFLFGSLFYLMFVVMNIMLHLQKTVRLAILDIALLIVINLGYYAAGIFILNHWHLEMYNGLFTASLGIINLALAVFFYKRKSIDKNFIYLLISITLTFISLTAPVQLSGNNITLFWAAEMVLLFWLYQKSFIKLLKIAVVLITILTLISLVMDWQQVYIVNNKMLPVLINKGFITTIFCAAAFAVMRLLMKKEADSFFIPGIGNVFVKKFYTVCSILLFFFSGLFETAFQFAHRYAGTPLQFAYIEAYIIAFFILLLLALHVLKINMNAYVRLGLALLVSVYYVMNIHSNYVIEKFLLLHPAYKMHYIIHCASIIMMCYLFVQTVLFVKKNKQYFENVITAFTWVVAILVIVFLSAECKQLYIWFSYHDVASALYAENLYNKAGLSIVWGLSSFILIWLGLHYSFKTLRIIALALFGITLFKLFVFDIRNVPPGGKILAFILLGAVLLTVSFMYQRIKKLIIDDTENKE